MKNFSPFPFIVPVIAAALLLLAACALLSGCYTLSQGSTMLGYLGRAIPLQKLADTSGEESGKTHHFIELVQDIRRFAMEELGLKNTKNYTTYVQLDRTYLAAVVSACAPDSFTPYQWRYPFLGAMPYKGFFNAADAQKERKKLEKKGLDVWIRGVDAFSTLGWFKDPLYSYMRDYSADRLAELIIHEQFHATVFIKGHVQFNEELAEFVGSEGARLYMESRFGIDSDEYRTMVLDHKDNKQYVATIQQLAAELETLYSSVADRDEKLREKERIIDAAKERFNAEYQHYFSNDNYRQFTGLPVNNAYLELYRLYYAGDGFFAGLYERSGKNFSAFIAAAKTITKKSAARAGGPRAQLAAALGLE